jgi:probable rRNA maturation factor
MASVNFFSKAISFKLPKPRKTSSWIQTVVKSEKSSVRELNFVFCSDEHLLSINLQYLNHKTYTDIITFDNSEHPDEIEGDIFISVERVKENAQKLHIPFQMELNRVIIHGVLHLLGYSDKTKAQIKEMRKKEDAYLSLWQSL